MLRNYLYVNAVASGDLRANDSFADNTRIEEFGATDNAPRLGLYVSVAHTTHYVKHCALHYMKTCVTLSANCVLRPSVFECVSGTSVYASKLRFHTQGEMNASHVSHSCLLRSAQRPVFLRQPLAS
jgi:hypothetical protein